MTLRQRHTEGAILYEKKLKPFLKSLNEGKGTDVRFPLGLLHRFQPVGSQRLFWGGENNSLTFCPMRGSHVCHKQGRVTRGRRDGPR